MDLEAWHDFNVAMAGATATLAGLVIVAASVNIARIITATTLTSRLGSAISTLVLALGVTAAGLIPSLHAAAYGWGIILASAGAAVFQVHATRVIAADPSPADHARFAKSSIGFLPLLGYAGGGALLIAGQPAGLMLIAVASLLAIVSGLVVSWVVLVEVLR